MAAGSKEAPLIPRQGDRCSWQIECWGSSSDNLAMIKASLQTLNHNNAMYFCKVVSYMYGKLEIKTDAHSNYNNNV